MPEIIAIGVYFAASSHHRLPKVMLSNLSLSPMMGVVILAFKSSAALAARRMGSSQG